MFGKTAVVLANNILPPPNILARASRQGVPLLLVPYDTFGTAKKVDDMEPLLMKSEEGKFELLTNLVRENVDLTAF